MKNTTFSILLAVLVLSASSATAQTNIDKELDNYWSTDRELPVVQDRLYSKDGRFGLGLYAGLMSSEPFYWYIPVGGRLSYHFNDYTGVEIAGQFLGGASSEGESGDDRLSRGPFTHETELTEFFDSEQGDGFQPRLHLEDRFLWRANASLVWNPFYGKWSFLNNKLSHFDFNLVLGGGVVSVERPDKERLNADVVITPEVTFGGGFGFFLTDSITLRLDGRVYVYQGAESASVESFVDRIQLPSEFLLGVSYYF